MEKALKAIVTLTALDKMSKVIQDAVGKSVGTLDQLKKKQQELSDGMGKGFGLIATGAGIAASMTPAIKAFAELEDSSAALEATMMKSGGKVSENFGAINDIAIELGNRMPGTTADFQNMMAMLIRSGVEEKSIMEGVGKAAANLAVVLKMPYEEAAQMAAKLKEATGVTNQEMLGFMDTIARVSNLGVSASEMQYAFGRSAGTLKLFGLQGLEASKSVANLYAQLIRAGASGETVGTNMSALFNSFFDEKKMGKLNEAAGKFGITMDFVDKKTGEFKGIENMVAQFDQLKNLSTADRAGIVQAFLGPGQDAQFMNTLINNGVTGFNEMNQKLQDQATLTDKVNKMTQTLSALWEAATGTVTNMLAALGESLGPELKVLTKLMGKLAESVQKFAKNNPELFKAIGIFMGLVSVGLMAAGAFKIATFAIGALKIAAMTNPVGMILLAVAAAASLIYAYWTPISAFFKNLWTNISSTVRANMASIGLWIRDTWFRVVNFFKPLWNLIAAIFKLGFNLVVGILVNFTPFGLIYKNWDKISAWFSNLWDSVKLVFRDALIYLIANAVAVYVAIKKPFSDAYDWVMGFADRFFDAGAKIVQMIADGIKSKINEATKAIEGVATKVREYLPFSPAKKGPFQTLHQVKFTETFAQSIKPGPAVKAMGKMAKAVRDKAASSGGGLRTGGGSTINYSPTINVGAGTNRDDLLATLRQHSRELLAMIQQEERKQGRTKFA